MIDNSFAVTISFTIQQTSIESGSGHRTAGSWLAVEFEFMGKRHQPEIG